MWLSGGQEDSRCVVRVGKTIEIEAAADFGAGPIERSSAMSETEVVEKVREAIKDRALYLALLYRAFAKAFPPEQVEKCAREAIYEYGTFKGQKDGGKITPEEWVEKHVSKGSGAVFQSTIVKEEECCEQRMTYCPLVEAWKELGCTREEIDLLCDIAMEVDRGRAEYHGIPWEIPDRMGKGDPSCRLVLKKEP